MEAGNLKNRSLSPTTMATNPLTEPLNIDSEPWLPAPNEDDPIHILVIEDDAINAELVHRIFEFHNGGQHLRIVGTIKEARACLEQFAVDLVIAELRLPDGTCLELVPGNKPEGSYPLIVMTNNGDEQIAVEAMKAGALDYVVKTHDSLENLPHLAERAVREWEALKQRKEAEKLQDLQKEILEKIVLGEPVIDILNTLCLHIQEMIPETICSVMLLEETTSSLHVLSAPSAPQELWAVLDGFKLGAQAASCGTAAYTGQAVFVLDTDLDPRWSEYQDLAKEFGIKGCWSIPIACEKNKILGTFAISHRISRSPTPFYRKLLETASYMAGITIQKRMAEDKLRSSEDQYRDLYESAPCGYFTSHLDGRIMSVNMTAVQLLGYTKTNLVGRSIFNIFAPTPQGREKALELLEQTKDLHEINGEQLEMQKANGSYFWVSLTVRLIRDSRHNPVGWRAIAMDITQKKRAEEALRRSEGRLRQVIDLVPHFIFAKDQKGRYILANQAVAEVYGTTVEHLIGRTDQELAPSKVEMDLFRREDVDVIQTGQVKVVEEEVFRDPSGQQRYLQTTKIPFIFANTTMPSILGVAIDITDRKQGEEALRLMERVFESSSDHLSVVGADYRYQQVNPMYERLHQRSAADIIGRHIADLLGEQTFTELIQPYFDRCLKGEEVSYESWFHFKNGQSRFMFVTYSPLRIGEHSNSIPAVVVTCRDLTHRKRFEEALKEKEQRLRRLLEERSRISQDLHDHILQSLYAIGLIIAAAKHPAQLGSYSETLGHLDDAITQLNDAISEIRCFIEGRPPETLPIQPFSNEINSLVKSLTLTGSTNFRIKIDEEAAMSLSKEQTYQLLNIARESMSNSVRHAQASDGCLRLKKTGNGLRFSIIDNGMGLQKGWEKTKGHGMKNMRARAEQMNGRFRIRTHPGKGTCVIVDLPLEIRGWRNTREYCL